MTAKTSTALRELATRRKDRQLPALDTVQTDAPEIARNFETIQEYFRLYEGDSNAPRQRFVTLAELEAAGLIKADVKSGFGYIAQVLGKDVAQQAGSTANPTLKDAVKRDTSRQSREPGGGGKGATSRGSTSTTAKLNDSKDVNVAKPAKNDFLYYNGNEFVNFSLFNKPNRWVKRQQFEEPIGLRTLLESPEPVDDQLLIYSKNRRMFLLDSEGNEYSIPAGPIDFRHFGGVGDGATDDTTAIDDTVAWAIASGNRHMDIPPGDWVYTGTLQLGELNGVRGSGAQTCVLRVTPAAGDPHVVYAPPINPWPVGPSEQAPLADSSDRENWGTVGGFKVKGAATAEVAGENGFQVGDDVAASASINGMRFIDIQVEQVGGSGVLLQRATYGCDFITQVHDCYGIGIEIADKTSNRCNANTFWKPKVQRCKEGIVVGESVDNTFHDAHLECTKTQTIGVGHAIRVDAAAGDVSSARFLGGTYIEWNETEEEEVVLIDHANYTELEGYFGALKAGTTNTNNLTAILRETTNSFRTRERIRFNAGSDPVDFAVDSQGSNTVRNNYYVNPTNYKKGLVNPKGTNQTFEIITSGGFFPGEYSSAPSIQYGNQLAMASATGFDGVSGQGLYRADDTFKRGTSTGISFTAPSTITATGSHLNVYAVGDPINVRGSAENTGDYTVATVTIGSPTVMTVNESTITTDTAGDSVLVYRPHWHYQGGDLPTRTATELLDEDDTINASAFKLPGKRVVNSTDGTVYFCEGDDKNDDWILEGDRTTKITPV